MSKRVLFQRLTIYPYQIPDHRRVAKRGQMRPARRQACAASCGRRWCLTLMEPFNTGEFQSMPFPRAHFYVAALLVTTFAAFMPSYFSILPQAPLAHHIHGVTATLWMVLLITQNWSIHHRFRKVHIWSGMASMALVPVFTIGGMLVTQRTLLRDSAFRHFIGERLALVDLFFSIAFVAFYALALRYRRTTALHARYMLATVFILAAPVISRLFANYVPGFLVRGPQDLPIFEQCIDISFVIAGAICLILVVRDRLSGQPIAPFAAAFGMTLLSVASYKWLGRTEAWLDVSAALMAMSPLAIAVGSVVFSGAAIWIGWAYPAPRRMASRPRPALRPAE